ncbi:hypothetical protein DPMN_115990 [Dreissena polymorpha]|uniref:Uncharacterized protein n=1 Tax=Dreissena polymorpha TaxID=45954 RepID=A0A9D4KN42_DREPO|nr:hypothetical protein DPMN_115990 [Dreissena polymorpha]
MAFATPKDDIKAVDSSVRNKWRWEWITNDQIGQYLRKTKLPGQAYCTWCNRRLHKYQSTGKKDLHRL